MTTHFDLQALAARVHLANKKWWVNLDTGAPLLRNPGELLMLTVSELSESLEGHRKNLPDDKLPHRRMDEVEIADALIRGLDIVGGWNIELVTVSPDWYMDLSDNYSENLLRLTERVLKVYAQAIDIRRPALRLNVEISTLLFELIRFAEHYRMDWRGAFEEKMAFNAVRADHTHEHRKGEHGKKF